MAKAGFLPAKEAAAELGVSLATLYAYVSRGLIRSEAAGGKRRARRYHAEDIQRLKERKEMRRNPARTTEQALDWGAPLLESELTLVADGGLFYRGQDALELARSGSIEQTAWLLWTGEAGAQSGRAEAARPAMLGFQSQAWEGFARLNAFQAALAQAESMDPAAFDLRPESVAQKGQFILHLLAGIAARREARAGAGIAETLQESWAPSRPQAARVIDAALVLCADHELNVSAFTARCVASAGSSTYAVVIAGLAALLGVRHGGMSRRVEALFQEVAKPERAQAALSGRLKRGESIPGFGHPLYPEGDPRARLLLELIGKTALDSKQVELAQAIAAETWRLIGERPTIDFALVTLARGLALPEDSAITIFALGRTVGWIAHAIEQYKTGRLIRPRARYTGPQPY